MNRHIAALIVASFALVFGTPPVISALADDHPGVEILVGGAPQRRYAHGGRWYVEALKGREYAIRLHNPYAVRVAVALSVDGLNTIDARQTTAADARKWVLDPYQTVTIKGWQTSQTEARRFEFTTEARSYGQALGATANLGVISAAFFKERARSVAPEASHDTAGRAAPALPRDRQGASAAAGKRESRRVRGDRDGPADRPRRHASVAGSGGRPGADGEHPLRVPCATRPAGYPAVRSDGRSAATPRTRARVRAGVLPRTAAPALNARVGRQSSVR